jgi:hypothetical protein
VWTPTPFGRSSLFVEFSRFLRARLHLQPKPIHPLSRPQQPLINIILVSRKGQNNRRITNEDAVIELLHTLPGTSVEVIDWVQMSGREQVAKAAAADVLIGMHGAGLAHIQYAHNDIVLVELHPMCVRCSAREVILFNIQRRYRSGADTSPHHCSPSLYCLVTLFYRHTIFPLLLPQYGKVARRSVRPPLFPHHPCLLPSCLPCFTIQLTVSPSQVQVTPCFYSNYI